MPRLVHKQPCNDCPYRRKAAPGWLGASEPEDFMEQTLGSQEIAHAMPCHQTIDYGDPDWKDTQYPDAPLCAGALQFLNNWLKMPWDPELVKACKAVGVNDEVFSNPTEFLRHHTEDADATWMTIGCRVVRQGQSGEIDLRPVEERLAMAQPREGSS